MTTSYSANGSEGLVRKATLRDAAEIDRLIVAGAMRDDVTPVSPNEVSRWLDRGQLLVLDRGSNTLGAVVHVDVGVGHANLNILVVDPTLADRDVEHCLCGVARALCVEYGCVSTCRGPRRSRGRR